MLQTKTYTLVRGNKNHDSQNPIQWSVIVIGRKDVYFRYDYFYDLFKAGFSEIIVISESGDNNGDFDLLLKNIPGMKLLIYSGNVTAGEKINMAMNEASFHFVAVLWNDLIFNCRVSSMLNAIIKENGSLCTVPLIESQNGEPVPSVSVPVMNGNNLKTLFVSIEKSGMQALFPFDYAGIYDREKFLLSGGFDSKISSVWWQLMDFGFRAYLWNERIITCMGIKISCIDNFIPMDISPDEGYFRFYMKNVAVKIDGDKGYLPKYELLRYILKSRGHLIDVLDTFINVDKWVKNNCFRFKSESRSIVGIWPHPQD